MQTLRTILSLVAVHAIHTTAVPCQNKPVGAAYTMSNSRAGNMILSHNIFQNGSITYGNATSTGGLGNYGVNSVGAASTTVDGLFAGASLVVDGNFLYSVNAGSNTVSMFAIDSESPTHLSLVGSPVSTGFEFPMSLAVSPCSTQLCVLNGGHSNGVLCYRVDKRRGLTAHPGTQRQLQANQTTPPSGPIDAFSNIIFSEDGTKLIVAIKGSFETPGYLATWEVYDDGSLSQYWGKTISGLGFPFQSITIKGTTSIFNADAGGGYGIYDFSNGTVASSKQYYHVAEQVAICWVAHSRKTGTYFITDLGASLVTEVQLNQNLVGKTIRTYPQHQYAGTIDAGIASIQSSDYLYVLSANTTSIDVLSIPDIGQATHMQTFNFAAAAKTHGVAADTRAQGIATYILRNSRPTGHS